ncbi:FAST kinase domain-containing protein 5, mitochondrial-like [Saccoglossus kowalevskii]|uniref:FAST kinase domain-containing protein 5-like n=1 Tax=Saccoglossus kowalevskii TaxID=10224 RepID=A0ABM0MBY7_SACKO|nr:PREDICTED: FAST kinase domain-containing protein 5-like [Saccoglossus kowalevskii]
MWCNHQRKITGFVLTKKDGDSAANKERSEDDSSKSERKVPYLLDEAIHINRQPSKDYAKIARRAFYADSKQYNIHKLKQSVQSDNKDISIKAERFLNDIADCQDSVDTNELVEGFIVLSNLDKWKHRLLKKDYRFHVASQHVTAAKFSSEEMVDLLNACSIIQVRPNDPLMVALERQCTNSISNWDLNTQLVISDLWRVIGRSVHSMNDKLFQHVELHWNTLTKHQLVQLVYLIGENRSCSQTLMAKLENLLLKYVDDLTINEIAAVCLGFFKSQTRLTNSTVLHRFGDRVCEHLHDINPICLVSILKEYRYIHFIHRRMFDAIGQYIAPRLHTMPVLSMVHICHTFASLHLFNKPFLDAVAKCAIATVPKCRNKDIAKYLYAFGSLNYEPPNADEFFTAMIQQMHRLKPEYDRSPEQLVVSLLSLAYLNQYHYSLLNMVFSPTFRSMISERGRLDSNRNLFVLHSSVKIERPNYNAHKLAEEFIQQLPAEIYGSVEHEISSRAGVAEVLAVLKEVVGEKYFKCCFILPHIRSMDIEIHVDPDGNYIPLNKNPESKINKTAQLDNALLHQLISPTGKKTKLSIPGVAVQLNSELTQQMVGTKNDKTVKQSKRLAVVITSPKHYQHESKSLLGIHVMKRRQLNLLGYTVIEIAYYEWNEVTKKGVEECKVWLKQQIDSAIAR